MWSIKLEHALLIRLKEAYIYIKPRSRAYDYLTVHGLDFTNFVRKSPNGWSEVYFSGMNMRANFSHRRKADMIILVFSYTKPIVVVALIEYFLDPKISARLELWEVK